MFGMVSMNVLLSLPFVVALVLAMAILWLSWNELEAWASNVSAAFWRGWRRVRLHPQTRPAVRTAAIGLAVLSAPYLLVFGWVYLAWFLGGFGIYLFNIVTTFIPGFLIGVLNAYWVVPVGIATLVFVLRRLRGKTH